MVSCNSLELEAALSAADFINSELWSSAVTVEMNGRGSVTLEEEERDIWMAGRERERERERERDAITVLHNDRC